MKKQTPAKTQTITVKVNEENPEPLELIAKSIIDIAEAFKKIENGPLKEKAIILLLQDATGLTQTAIRKVLMAGPRLKEYYVRELKQVKN